MQRVGSSNFEVVLDTPTFFVQAVNRVMKIRVTFGRSILKEIKINVVLHLPHQELNP